jgi:hypothetical protein
MAPHPQLQEKQPNRPVAGQARGGFARRRGTIVVPVTPKTSVRLWFKASLPSCSDQSGCDKMRTALFHFEYE